MSRDYFAGCDNVPMFDAGPTVVELPAVDAPTLAEVVAAIVGSS